MKTTLNVKTSTSYNITIGHGWNDLAVALGYEGFSGKICIVTDSNVAPLYLQQVSDCFLSAHIFHYIIEAGESSKNAVNYLEILGYLAQNKFNRQDVILALGGGVVGDLAGFVAATYMRGIAYCQLPTTLLAMIDSSVGGKTAIDIAGGKNLVGAFYQPSGVFINLDTLSTLPQEELANGRGELLKYAFLDSSVTFPSPDDAISEQLVAQCLKVKIGIVQNDEKESGLRMLLNLGHTVGHAVEALSNFTIPHGLCVAKGLQAALGVSQRYFNWDAAQVAPMQKLLESSCFDLSLPFAKEAVLQKIEQDKKAGDGFVKFVLIENIGRCSVQKISFEDLKKLL